MIPARHGHGHLDHRAGSGGSGRQPGDPDFFGAVATALQGVREVLVVGPASAKVEFVGWLEKHRPPVRKAVMGVETVDHPSDGQLLDFARRWFKPVDQMRGDVT